MLVFGLLHFSDEHLIDLVGASLNELSDGLSLGKIVKCLYQFDTLLDGFNDVKGKLDAVLVDVVKVFHFVLEGLVIILPVAGTDVKDLIQISTS